jgi:transcriptional regulator with XRE-family HTH domain
MKKELEEWYKLHMDNQYYDYLTKELAEYLKVSPRTIQRWVKGKADPKKNKLNLIKKYLAQKTSDSSPI